MGWLTEETHQSHVPELQTRNKRKRQTLASICPACWLSNQGTQSQLLFGPYSDDFFPGGWHLRVTHPQTSNCQQGEAKADAETEIFLPESNSEQFQRIHVMQSQVSKPNLISVCLLLKITLCISGPFLSVSAGNGSKVSHYWQILSVSQQLQRSLIHPIFKSCTIKLYYHIFKISLLFYLKTTVK